MTELYLIRHAEAEGNLYRRCHGQHDGPVTSNGHLQIERLRDRFREIHIDAVYSSDLSRAVLTAEAVYKERNIPFYTDLGLREIALGEWEDRTWGEIYHRDRERAEKFNNRPWEFTISGGESGPQAAARIHLAVLEIVGRNRGKTVCAVSHGCALHLLLCALYGLPLERIDEIPWCDNTGVAHVLFDRELNPTIVYANDNSHLPEELSTYARQQWWRKDTPYRDTNLWFRPALPSDADMIGKWRGETWRAIYGDLRAYDEDANRGATLSAIARYPEDVLIAMLDDTPCGVLQLDPEERREEGCGHINFLCLDAEYRGIGIGAQLIGEAVSRYRSLGRSSVSLRVNKRNPGAVRFYEYHGFERISATGAGGGLLLMNKEI